MAVLDEKSHTRKPIHTPYDGSSKPFAIGLSPLDPDRWIEPDDDLGIYLAEKNRLAGIDRNLVFRAELGTEDAQRECLDLLLAHLAERHGATHFRAGSHVELGAHRVDVADGTLPPLYRAGLLVQDDLLILRRRETGWHLVAAHVSFPSSWALDDKIGRPMEEIHAPVPGFQAGTRNASLINRIFDNLQASQPVERWNWSINRTDDLYLPKSKSGPADPVAPAFEPLKSFVRIERQTLRCLPLSGDIVFTIRIYSDPIKAVLAHPNSAELASKFADQLEALNDDQVLYKGLIDKKNAFVGLLRGASAQENVALTEI
ncbi:DUF3445 domain-containing protein [Rhizobiaceae bacterium n13]|uniref:DUF3445 domain-containing protein n=1 Tax=Ferirhizobium litorale TaxID=2927786 RepID=A0AAE3QC54_9HYPH|nr:DUF3445 domain-containing protein [Fererhizobium litorale]MDI7860523.1 DUF3445 domain-containing protein [Fererhizobium litorale]MDI7920658.1 DUF3445 domain-containing protein [Fererhizobium litorale]